MKLPLCVNTTPAYDRISKIRARSSTQHQLKFHICEAQQVRRRCVSLKCFSVQPLETNGATKYMDMDVNGNMDMGMDMDMDMN